MTLSQLRRHIIGSELPQSFPVRAKGFPDTFVQVHQLLMEYVLAGMIGRFEVQVVLPRSDECKVNYAHAGTLLLTEPAFLVTSHSSSRDPLFCRMSGEKLPSTLY